MFFHQNIFITLIRKNFVRFPTSPCEWGKYFGHEGSENTTYKYLYGFTLLVTWTSYCTVTGLQACKSNGLERPALLPSRHSWLSPHPSIHICVRPDLNSIGLNGKSPFDFLWGRSAPLGEPLNPYEGTAKAVAHTAACSKGQKWTRVQNP